MKIGIACQNYPPATYEGGISHYSRLLAVGLRQRGHDVHALTSTEFARPQGAEASSDGVKIVKIQGPWDRRTVGEMRAIAKERGLEAIILEFSPASFSPSFRIAWALSRFDGQKITAFHTLWGKGADRMLGMLTLLGSQKIIATNSEIMFLLEKYLPRFLPKTYWIPIGSNILPDLRGGAAAEPSPKPIISYFGMLYSGKGLDLILDCLQKLGERGHPFAFKFIGGGMHDQEVYEADFRREISRRNLQNDVEHLGLVSEREVSLWLSRSRFVFLPYDRGVSDRRGTLMAAIAHGKAVLTSPPVVDMPFLKNGINLCWPDKHAIGEYLAWMERLLRDDALVERLEAGARRLSSFFDWSRIVSDHELVLRQP